MEYSKKELLNKINQHLKRNKRKLLAGLLTTSLLLTGCNRTLFDTKYGFNKAIITGDNTAITLDVDQWKDYHGEQIQLLTTNNFALLTSSFDTNCFYGNSAQYSANEISKNSTENGEVYNITKDDNHTPAFNKDLFDTRWSFNKSITFNENHALILPIGQWKDYSGEQIQVITKDGLVLVLSSYHSKLVSDEDSSITAKQFAESYIGSDGKVTDLSNNNESNFNYDLIDTKYNFNKIIILKEDSCVILPITEWCDYEGEQLQVKIKNGPTLLTAAYDTILVNDNNSTLKAIDIANGLSDNVIDLATNHTEEGIFNKTIIDLNYRFSNTILSNDNSSSSLKIDKWTDYEGEQLQIKLNTGDVILSSSIMLDLINGGTSSLNASKLSEMYISDSGKNINKDQTQ